MNAIIPASRAAIRRRRGARLSRRGRRSIDAGSLRIGRVTVAPPTG
jgi:hypothetical protein